MWRLSDTVLESLTMWPGRTRLLAEAGNWLKSGSARMRNDQLMMDKPEKPRFFYGWVIAIACFFIALMLGATFYSFGVFFKPLQDEFGWGRAATSSANTIYLLGFAISTYVLGRLADKYGPRIVLIGGAILVGAGFALCSQVHDLWQLRLFFFIAALGSGATWAVPTATVQRWFLKWRAFMLAIVITGVGAGALIFAPLLSHLIATYGWRMAYILLGGLSWLVLTLSGMVMHLNPESRGLKPYGWEELGATGQVHPSTGKAVQADSKIWAAQEWSAGEATRTKAFYLLGVIYALTVVPIYIISAHVVRYAIDLGVSPTVAAGVLGITGGVSIAGRIVMGGAAEKIGWKKALAICCFGAAAMILWLIGAKSLWMLYVFAIIYGFFYGGKVPQIPGLVGFFFGTKSLAELIGITHAIAILIGSGGPLLAGYIFDATGSYAVAFIICVVCFLAAGVLTMIAKPPRKRDSAAI